MKTALKLIAIMTMTLLIVGIASAAGLPFVDFTGDPTTGPAPLTVNFNKITQNTSPALYTWNFGDGWTLTGASPSHTYQVPGKYDVTLEMNGGLWSYTMSKSEYITVTHNPPVAGFTFNPHVGNLPLDVDFTSTTTGEEYTLAWDFGDGGTGSGTSPSHTYSVAGDYTINLTATNDGGSDSFTDTITVRPAAPIASFTTDSPATGSVPLAVKFKDTSTGEGITSYLWDFGAGPTSTEQNPLHAYGSTGLYTVSLTVSSISGSDTSTRINFINVTEVTGPVICPTPEPTPEPTLCPNETPIINPIPKIGIYKDGNWYLDSNGNGIWNAGTDKAYTFGAADWKPIRGDWNGDDITDIGVTNGQQWYLDMNNNGVWDVGTDKSYSFGALGWNPVVGDWDQDGFTEIGISNGQTWYLDYNGNGVWDTGTDKVYNFGAPGWIPLLGNWI